jgi:DNA-binding protein YbaB
VKDGKPTPRATDAWSDYERMRDELAGLRSSVQEITETAYSPDELVRATVDAQGQLMELALDPRIYRTTNSAALAETIKATIGTAVAAATARVLELTKPFLPDGPPASIDDPDGEVDLTFDPLLRQLDRHLGRDER